MELTEKDLEWAKEAIGKTGLFSACSDEELASLLDGLDKQHFNKSATVLFQGEISSKLCIVQNGKVAVWARQGKDKAKVAELGPNSYFGEISLLTPKAANATIKAEDDADIVFLPGEVIQALVKSNPALADAINKEIEGRIAARKQALDQEKGKK